MEKWQVTTGCRRQRRESGCDTTVGVLLTFAGLAEAAI
jgi:hypothetical protein